VEFFCFLHGMYHGEGSLSPSRLGCGVLFSESSGLWSLCYLCLFSFLFFSFSGRRSFPKRPAGCSCFRFVSPVERFCAQTVSTFDARSTFFHWLSRDTRRPDGFTVVFLLRRCLFPAVGIIGDRRVIVTRQ
jgi:hypothetical protein